MSVEGVESSKNSPDLLPEAEAAAALREEELSKATPPRGGAPSSPAPFKVSPSSPTTDNPSPRLTLDAVELRPAKASVEKGAGDPVPSAAPIPAPRLGQARVQPRQNPTIVAKKQAGEDDDLAKRFAALKR